MHYLPAQCTLFSQAASDAGALLSRGVRETQQRVKVEGPFRPVDSKDLQ